MRDSRFQENGEDIFPIPSAEFNLTHWAWPIKQTYEGSDRRKEGCRPGRDLGTKDLGVCPLGFLLVSYISKADKASSLEMPKEAKKQTNKMPNQNLLSICEGQKKEKPRRQKNPDSNCPEPTNHWKTSPTSTKATWGLWTSTLMMLWQSI